MGGSKSGDIVRMRISVKEPVEIGRQEARSRAGTVGHRVCAVPALARGGVLMYDPKRGYPAVVPCVIYDDFSAVVPWLTRTLGFREMVRATLPTGWSGHVELERDRFVILPGRRAAGLRRITASCRSTSTMSMLAAMSLSPPVEPCSLIPLSVPGACVKPLSPTRRANAGY